MIRSSTRLAIGPTWLTIPVWPTAGRTPDHCTHGLPVGQTAIVSQVGPLARRVEDLVIGLRVLDRARDPYVVPGPELGDPAAVDLTRLRFATFTDDGEFPVAPAVRRAVAEAAAMLTAAGARAVDWKPPPLSRATDLLFATLSADRAQSFRRLLRGNEIDRRVRSLLLAAGLPLWLRGIAGFTFDVRGQRRSARNLRRFASGSVDEYWQTVEAVADFRNELLRSFDTADGGPIDVVICPAYAVPAVRHGATELMPIPGAYGPIANVSGFPAGVVPVTRVRSAEESDRLVKPRCRRYRGAGMRARQRRSADRRASDCAAMARPCRARRHGRNRSGRKKDAGLSGAAPAMNE